MHVDIIDFRIIHLLFAFLSEMAFSHDVHVHEFCIFQIENYITSDTSNAPLLLIGNAGSGKSAIMAKSANDALVKAERGELPGAK